MATKTIKANVQQRSDTASNWTEKNPVLLDGEIAIVRTSAGETRVKIGDGVKSFTQLPYADERILNNVVTSVNGQTGDVTLDAVKYIEQTLTDEEKKQVRENIGAVDLNNGLLATNCVLVSGFDNVNKTVYVKNGVMLPLDYSTASGDLKNAIFTFSWLIFKRPLIFTSIDRFTTDFATLITNDIFGTDFFGTATFSNSLCIYDDQFSPKVEICLYNYYDVSDSRKAFVLKVEYNNGSGFSRIYNPFTSEYINNATLYRDEPLAEYAQYSTNTPAVSQFNMAADPTSDMQVATKKYVDSSIPTIPESLKNPNALTFTGAATGTYDGSEAVTINIPETGATSGKLTFTGGATGEYDGSSDVSVTIPEDRFYVLDITPHEDNTFTIANDFDEAIAAAESGKIITDGAGTIVTLTGYAIDNPSSCHLYATIGDTFQDIVWIKSTGIGTIEGYYNMPAFNALETNTPLSSSGAAYWDKDKSEWTIKDISAAQKSDIYILNMVSETVDGTEVTKITNNFDEAIEAINTHKIIAIISDVDNASPVLTQINTDDSGVTISVTIMCSMPGYIASYDWIKETGEMELIGVYEVPYLTVENSSSGVFYRDGGTWTVKDPSEFSLPYCVLRYSEGTFNKSEAEIKQAFQKGAFFLLDTASGEPSSSKTVSQVLQPLYPYVISANDHIPTSIDFSYISELLPGDPQIITLRWNYNRNGLVTVTTRRLLSYKAGNGISISDDGTISVTAAKMYSGTSTPADSLGENGDIYVQTEG